MSRMGDESLTISNILKKKAKEGKKKKNARKGKRNGVKVSP